MLWKHILGGINYGIFNFWSIYGRSVIRGADYELFSTHEYRVNEKIYDRISKENPEGIRNIG